MVDVSSQAEVMDSSLVVLYLEKFSLVYGDSLQGACISQFSQASFQNIFEQYIMLLNFELILGIFYLDSKRSYWIMDKGINSEISLGFKS